MKLIHLADLHLGKRVNGFSMIEDQKYILKKIEAVIDAEKPQAVLISGDVYDRSIPSEEAVELLDSFLVTLAQKKLQVLLISGNHDSAERVAFGSRLMNASGIHVSPVFDGRIEPVTLTDGHGEVKFWLIPFVKPAHVARYVEEGAEKPETYTAAMKMVVDGLPLDETERNVALVHQFITGGSISDSEEHSVGGLDDISAEVFDTFDYVALGHLHGPQSIGRDAVRYAGSPLKYSFSEANQKKSVTVVELGEKGAVEIRTVPLIPLRDMKRISGEFETLMSDYDTTDDYYEITLTDEEDISNAMTRLRVKFPNLMLMKYDNSRTNTDSVITGSENAKEKHPVELFDELFEAQNGRYMTEEQKEFLSVLVSEIWEETK